LTMRVVLAVLLVSCVAVSATNWDRLDVTWAKFSGIPLTASDAAKDGWTLSGSCSDATSWSGNRYLLNGDLSSGPIYDAGGHLAGYQFGIYETPPAGLQNIWTHQPSTFSPTSQPYWTLTTYFVDPKTMCQAKAPGAEMVMRHAFDRLGAIGDRLVLQVGNGTLINMPLQESDAPKNGWVKGKCFISMGQHYWYNLSPSLPCEQFFPLFLIYNRGVLTTYGADTGMGNAQHQTSSRWEHPGGSVIKLFMSTDQAPPCIFTAGELSTQHVFLTNPIFDLC